VYDVVMVVVVVPSQSTLTTLFSILPSASCLLVSVLVLHPSLVVTEESEFVPEGPYVVVLVTVVSGLV